MIGDKGQSDDDVYSSNPGMTMAESVVAVISGPGGYKVDVIS